MCDHGAVQVAALTVLLWLLRRVRPMGVAVLAYETWRRLPPAQRQRLLLAAGRQAPKLAVVLARRARPRPLR